MKYLITILATLTFLGLSNQVLGQDSLQVRYDNLLKESETFQQYKVIPRAKLDAFWIEAVDSLSQNKKINRDLKTSIDTQEKTIESLNIQVTELQQKLDESLEFNDSISFLGINFSKVAYHIFVWVIILSLVALSSITYMMFARSNKQTTKFKKELVNLTTEFENHRDKAREQQMKLKRELQTAINQLSERR